MLVMLKQEAFSKDMLRIFLIFLCLSLPIVMILWCLKVQFRESQVQAPSKRAVLACSICNGAFLLSQLPGSESWSA